MSHHDLATVERLTSARRSSLLVDRERPVPPELVERLCGLVASAPNHKRTRPWRLAVCTGVARAAIGGLWADALERAGTATDAKVAKTRTKYTRSPVVLVVGCAPEDDPHRHLEDRCAVAAGVQSVLLGATAAGLASFWGSPPVPVCEEVNVLLGFEPGTTVVGAVYLGWPTAEPPPITRPPVEVAWVGDQP
jgi:nitroreductase